MGRGWNWENWDRQEKLPVGIAALIAFLVGWAGAILCMAQVWYVGPIAKEVGDNGADVSCHLLFTQFSLPSVSLENRRVKHFRDKGICMILPADLYP